MPEVSYGHQPSIQRKRRGRRFVDKSSASFIGFTGFSSKDSRNGLICCYRVSKSSSSVSWKTSELRTWRNHENKKDQGTEKAPERQSSRKTTEKKEEEEEEETEKENSRHKEKVGDVGVSLACAESVVTFECHFVQ